MTQPLVSFPGGLKLASRKKRSTQIPIGKIPMSNTLVLPLQQNIGEAAKPCVKVGDKVLKGQKIAEANGHISVGLHASSSGTITAIGEHPVPHPSGLSAPCIAIATDGEDRWINRRVITDLSQISSHDLCELIRDAGIVGLGGAGFPSFIKLNPRVHHDIDTLILNGAECEPYITCDDMIMRERAHGVMDGIEVMQQALNVKDSVIVIEEDKPEALSAMRTALSSHRHLRDNTRVVVIPTRYPTGSEKAAD